MAEPGGPHDKPKVREVYPSHILRGRLLAMLEGSTGTTDGNALVSEFSAKAPPEFIGEAGIRMLEAVRAIGPGTPEEVVDAALPHFQEWVAEQFGSAAALEEASRGIRQARRERGEDVGEQVNELVNYTLHIRQDGSVGLALHIEMAGGMLMERPLALVGKFRSAMRDIAHRLTTEPALAVVTVVTGTSPLVPKFAPALERMGFIIERDQNGLLVLEGNVIKMGHMEMPREDFLQKFGS